jgi:hypothetical protein
MVSKPTEIYSLRLILLNTYLTRVVLNDESTISKIKCRSFVIDQEQRNKTRKEF